MLLIRGPPKERRNRFRDNGFTPIPLAVHYARARGRPVVADARRKCNAFETNGKNLGPQWGLLRSPIEVETAPAGAQDRCERRFACESPAVEALQRL